MDVMRLPDHRHGGDHRTLTEQGACPATPRFSTPVPASADAAEIARAFAQAHTCEEHGLDAAGAVQLLVSELVTHALFHGAPPITVTVECQVRQVRVTVSDGSPGIETPESVHRELSRILVRNVGGSWELRTGQYGESFSCTIPTGEA
jgi:two-component sensor histidine kinase